MRKTGMVCLMLLAGLYLCGPSMAQEMKGMKDMDHGMGSKAMMGCQGGCPMKGAMMGKSVVATSDGGVVIVAGNKIIKYDKNLKLVKEVEIDAGMGMARKGMKGMMKDCPMMKDMDEQQKMPVPEK